jgi:hypothetical protein
VSSVPLKLLLCEWPLQACAAFENVILVVFVAGVNPSSAMLVHGVAPDAFASVTAVMSLIDAASAMA